MLKKHSLLLMLGMATSTTYAHAPVFSGLYLGANVGGFYDAAKIDTVANVIVSDDDTTLSSSQDLRVWRANLFGSLTVGYGGYLCPKFHLAAEGYYSIANRNAYLDNFTNFAGFEEGEDALYIFLNTKTTAHLHKGEFGIDILPGYLFEPHSIIYARFGVGFNRLNISSNSLLTAVNVSDTEITYAYSPLGLSQNNTKHPFRLGLGIEHEFCPKLSLSIDYIYSHYGYAGTNARADVVTFDEGDVLNIPNGFFSTASTRLYTQSLTLGFKYYFC